MRVEIPRSNMESLQKKFKKLQKLATKLNVEKPTLTVVEETEREINVSTPDGRNRTYKVKTLVVEVEATTLVLPGGWKLVGVVDHQAEGMVRTVPGEEVPKQYWGSKDTCDHCGVNRYRTETFVVRNEQGEYKKVGRQCVQDFLGVDGNDIARWHECVSDSALYGDAEDEDYCRGGGGVMSASIQDVLDATMACVRLCGWVSGSKAYEERIASTSAIVSVWLFDYTEVKKHWKESEYLISTDEEKEEAKKIVEWVKGIEPNSDYMFNITKLVEIGYVTDKYMGYACSIVPVYWSAMERKKKAAIKQENGKTSEWQGKEKERMVFKDVDVVGFSTYETHYGPGTMVKFVDKDGNFLVWFASGYRGDWKEFKGDIKATVKKHDTFNDIKQTLISRVTEEKK